MVRTTSEIIVGFCDIPYLAWLLTKAFVSVSSECVWCHMYVGIND